MNNYNPFSLVGKTILVTGASSGIGRAIAIECSKMGATLILTARNEQRLNETLSSLEGQGHKTVLGDLTNEVDLKTIVDQIDKIDGLVLCAGVSVVIPLKMATPKKFYQHFQNNFFSTVEFTRLLHKGKKFNDEASIVVISSVAGSFIFASGNGIYGSAKSALSTWAKFLAKEISLRGIRVNSILPGMIETPLIHINAIDSQDLKKDMDQYPLKRYGRPEEVAYAAVYLLSDTTKWMTGSDLVIDGGISLR